jgi:hypothetical protein
VATNNNWNNQIAGANSTITLTSANNTDITLAPSGTGVVSVTAAPVVPSTDRADSLGSATNSWDNVYADGLTFDDGTNVLGNYVDVTTWTPTLEFGGGTTGITYSAQNGHYSRIGNIVVLRMEITLTNKGSSTGTATITGFPLAVYGGITPLSWRVSNLTFVDIPVFRIVTSTITCEEIASAGVAAVLTDADFTNTTFISLSGVALIV